MYIERHHKIYLTRSQTRAMGMEHPIGDPYGGPAYGERNEPVSAVLAVVGMAATAEAAFAGSIMAGIAFAGSAISLVGNLTGNSTLSKIGAVAGLIGGAGAAGLFGEAAQGATWAGTFGTEAAGAGAGPGAALSQTPTAMPDVTPSSVVPDVGAPVQQLAANPVASLNAPPAQNLVSQATPSLSGTPLAQDPTSPFYGTKIDFTSQQLAPGAQTPVSAPAAPTVGAPTAPAIPGARPDLLQSAGVVAPGQSSVVAGSASQPGFFDSLKAGNYFDAAKAAGSGIMDLAKSNPGAAYMVGMAASGVGDVLSGKTAAQIAQMEASGELSKAQAEKIRYEIELAKKRREQLAANYATPLGFTINPNGVQFGQQPGLINGARGG